MTVTVAVLQNDEEHIFYKIKSAFEVKYLLGPSSRYMFCVHKLQSDVVVVQLGANTPVLVKSSLKRPASITDQIGILGK